MNLKQILYNISEILIAIIMGLTFFILELLIYNFVKWIFQWQILFILAQLCHLLLIFFIMIIVINNVFLRISQQRKEGMIINLTFIISIIAALYYFWY